MGTHAWSGCDIIQDGELWCFSNGEAARPMGERAVALSALDEVVWLDDAGNLRTLEGRRAVTVKDALVERPDASWRLSGDASDGCAFQVGGRPRCWGVFAPNEAVLDVAMPCWLDRRKELTCRFQDAAVAASGFRWLDAAGRPVKAPRRIDSLAESRYGFPNVVVGSTLYA